jgi:hypothetical protein
MRASCRLSDLMAEGFLSRIFDGHRGRCLRCQADAARTRGVSRDLGGLEEETLQAPGGLHTQVMARLPVQDAANPRRDIVLRLVARYATAIAVAVATLAAILGRRMARGRRA